MTAILRRGSSPRRVGRGNGGGALVAKFRWQFGFHAVVCWVTGVYIAVTVSDLHSIVCCVALRTLYVVIRSVFVTLPAP